MAATQPLDVKPPAPLGDCSMAAAPATVQQYHSLFIKEGLKMKVHKSLKLARYKGMGLKILKEL